MVGKSNNYTSGNDDPPQSFGQELNVIQFVYCLDTSFLSGVGECLIHGVKKGKAFNMKFQEKLGVLN